MTYSRDRQSSGRYNASTTATVVCAEGYRGGDITCQADSTWSDRLPNCTSESVIYYIDRATNTKAISSYVCISPPLPLLYIHTVIDCGSPPTLDNGQIGMQNTTTFGSMVTYECNENYFFDDGTKPSRTCLSSGEWSNEDIRCSKSDL